MFSYKMTSDTGFAPNPFGRTLTLATCKPMIRRSKHEGDWIAGFTSKTLNGDEVGSERLIYLMHVAEKLLLRDYFSDARFQDKIPDMSARGPAIKAGDNIYRPLRAGCLSQSAPAHATFALEMRARPPRLFVFEATYGFTCVTAR